MKKHEGTGILSKLGLTEVRLNNVEPGLKKLKDAVLLDPNAPELHDRLIAAFISGGRLAEAAVAADAKLQAAARTPSMYLRSAALWKHSNHTDRAVRVLSKGIEEFPQSAELIQAYSELNIRALEISYKTDAANSAAG